MHFKIIFNFLVEKTKIFCRFSYLQNTEQFIKLFSFKVYQVTAKLFEIFESFT